MKVLKSAIVMLLILAMLLCGCQVQNPNGSEPVSGTPSSGASEPSDSSGPSAVVTEPTESTEPTIPSQTEPEPPSLDLGYYTAEHYLYYPDLFVPSWAGEWEVPEEMLDFEKKYAEFMDPNGRLMSIGHRADRNQLYPENSIEAILSAIAAGVDIVELDIAKTKDNVLILMHDETLDATTNVSIVRAKGEIEGLPATNKVSDWTLEQLRQLRLLKGGRVTNYIIPTLEEAIMICKNHCFITLDKVDRLNWQTDVYPLMQKHEAYREVLLPYKYAATLGMKKVNNILQMLKNESGYDIPYISYCGLNDVSMDVLTGHLEQYGLCKTFRCTEYYPEDLTLYASYIGKFRIQVETLEKEHDNVATWTEIADAGLGMIMTNNYTYDLCKFIAQRYFSE